MKQALLNDGWEITSDPYIISYGRRFLFIDFGAVETPNRGQVSGPIIGAQRAGQRIAVEVKEFRGKSVIADLEQAIGQYILYRLLLQRVDPDREMYLAVTDVIFEQIFSEPIGNIVVNELPLKLIVVNIEQVEVRQWIPLPIGIL